MRYSWEINLKSQRAYIPDIPFIHVHTCTWPDTEACSFIKLYTSHNMITLLCTEDINNAQHIYQSSCVNFSRLLVWVNVTDVDVLRGVRSFRGFRYDLSFFLAQHMWSWVVCVQTGLFGAEVAMVATSCLYSLTLSTLLAHFIHSWLTGYVTSVWPCQLHDSAAAASMGNVRKLDYRYIQNVNYKCKSFCFVSRS